MTSAGWEAGTGQAGQPADAGRDTPGLEHSSKDAAAGQADQAAMRPEPALSGPAPSGPAPSEQSREDTDIAWGDYPRRDDEDRLYRDRPPHWADY
jgi:hypothetical protein